MKVSQLLAFLNEWAPPFYQESYDNTGLLVGDANEEIQSVLVSLDVTEAVLDEALQQGCNVIVSHHPVIFSGIKKITGSNYTERLIIKALRNNLNLIAVHTNLDNITGGVNSMIASKLGLQNTQILAPKKDTLKKLTIFVPNTHTEEVRNALFAVGAGNLGNYSECSFNSEGYGTFKGNENAQAFVGKKNEQHKEKETKVELIFPAFLESSLIREALSAHPYEEVAYNILALENSNAYVGSGIIGELPNSKKQTDFLDHVKKSMELEVLKYTPLAPTKAINKVAVCGGSGSFLLRQALSSQADAFISADFKYHEFFGNEAKIMNVDIGHYESEKFTIDLIAETLQKNHNFVVCKTRVETNPIKYY